MLAVSPTLTWQRVATKNHLIMARNPHFFVFSLPVVKFLQHICITITPPLPPPSPRPAHSYIWEIKQILDFINLVSFQQNLIRCLILWMEGSLLQWISLALILFGLCYDFTFTKTNNFLFFCCFFNILSRHVFHVARQLQFSKAVSSLFWFLSKRQKKRIKKDRPFVDRLL